MWSASAVAMCLAVLQPLALPAHGLRSAPRRGGAVETFKGFRAKKLNEVKSDPRWGALKEPEGDFWREGRKTIAAGCSIRRKEACPLKAMRSKTRVFPGGNTKCLNGEDYYFEVIPGASDKLLIHFEGGGFCFSSFTLDMGLCPKGISPRSDSAFGFFNTCPQGASYLQNPFADYTAIHARYCSGDMFAGNKRTDWNITINHTSREVVQAEQRGYWNALAVFDWAKTNMNRTLESIVMSGTAAGAVGARIWAVPMLTQMSYKRATVIVDSYIPVFPNKFDSHVMLEIGVCDLPIFGGFPPLLDKISLCMANNLTIVELVNAIISTFPDVTFAQIQSKFDYAQMFWYDAIEQAEQLNLLQDSCRGDDSCYVSTELRTIAERMRLHPETFYQSMEATLELYSRNPNYSWYLLSGEFHGLADYIFGNCSSFHHDYKFKLPDFNIDRRKTLQQWIINSTVSTPTGICEDFPYMGLNGSCVASLGGIIL